MHLVVYIDLIFLVNVVMDFVILFVLKELLKEQASIQRLSIAAAIASFGSCITIVISVPAFVRFLFLYVVVSSVVLKIAFRIKGIRDFLIKLAGFFGIAFFLDGFLNFLYYRLRAEEYYKKLFAHTVFQGVPIIYLVAGIGGILLLSPFMSFICTQIREKILLLRHVEMKNQGRCVKGIGLLDTGNMLFDPLSGEPVMIAEFSWIKELFTVKQQLALVSYMKMNQRLQFKDDSESEIMKIRMIPFHSMGEDKGMLVAVRLDSILIGAKSDGKCLENVLIGLYPGKLSEHEKYQVILHNHLS